MRYLLVILLIATFPLRGMASAGMQTGMGLMVLHQASLSAEALAQTALNTPSSVAVETAPESAPHATACCAQCSSCDLCHLLLGQVRAPAQLPLAARPPAAVAAAIAFASAELHRAHKPPLALI